MTETSQTDGYLRYPHLHGDLVAFVAEDDVWVAPLDGGRAWRVSADRVPVAHPRFSPDGTTLAWASTRDGAPEVHVAPVDGGPSRRLTHWGNATTWVVGWTPQGEVLAASAVGRRSRANPWAKAVPLDGGPARELPYGRLRALAFEPGGDRVLIRSAHHTEPAWWKRYRGGTAGKLWIGTEGGEFTRVHADLDSSLDSPLWIGGRIAFLSDHEGTGQLYSSLPDGSDLRRHTDHEFYARNAAGDGTRVVYHSGGDLWLLEDLDGAQPRRIPVRLGGPRTSRQPHPVPAARHLGAVAVDQEARGSVIEVRGTLHKVAHRDGPSRVLSAAPGVRNRLPQTLPDGASVWITDAEGEDALEFSDGRRILTGEIGRVEELAASPDGSRVALATRDGRVLVVHAADGALRTLQERSPAFASGLAFSPDSGWLAWSAALTVEEGRRQLQLARLDTGEVHPVTDGRFNDYAPGFTSDGKHLAFLSLRTFDPVYDAHVFDLSFQSATRPYLLTLAADTLSPFGPQPDGRALVAPKEEENDSEGTPATRIDLDGLADRIVPFPVPAGRYGDLRGVKGGVVWISYPASGVLGTARATLDADPERPSLERFDFATRKVQTLVDALDGYQVSGDGSRLAVLDEGELSIVPADRKAGEDNPDDKVRVDLSRVRVTVDPAAEWRQMFDETARLMAHNFWRADMGGVDWDAVQARYRPLVERVGAHGDLVDLLWELVGELGTSHAYVMPPGGGAPAVRRQGLLGADLAPDEDGVWRVVSVLPGESSDPHARSPLSAPGVAVRAGDAVLAVDGVLVDPVAGPGPLLVGTADKPVELTVAPRGGESRTVVVVPLADESQLRYQAWVADRRAHVHEASGGKLGYVHVPDMVGNGWAQLHRDFGGEVQREGLIVDTRENRGGHTSQLIIEKLNRRIIGWDLVRDHGTLSYPGDAPRGPVVSVADEHAGSDGDIVNAAFQALGLGPVVGTRTWGGVIGIDGRYSLVDGTSVTQPRYSMWIEGYGWDLENRGVTPDVEVPFPPHAQAAGEDPQLTEAIRLALTALTRNPAATAPEMPAL